MKHIPVLLKETIEGMNISDGDVILDGTLGAGGHSEAICEQGKKDITLIGIDADGAAIERSKKRLEKYTDVKFHFIKNNSVNLDTVLEDLGISKVDKYIFDLGLSSYQLDEDERGFTFHGNQPLTMTFNDDPGEGEVTAYDVVNHFEEESLSDIIFGFGGERYARKIAKAIVKERMVNPIKTTEELVTVIKRVTPMGGKIHPATKTFQAIRIAVNREIENLPIILEKSYQRLSTNGRISVITFHSLEDRIVKTFFRDKEDEGKGKRITKKPIPPTDEEVKNNPRSRSAKLRIFELN
jgi:16S rRNA (cytosine1402-N4)-methyltransferase